MNKKDIRLLILILFVGLLIIAGTFSLYIWDANDNKDVVFNTSKKLQEYIIYDSGESKFVGDFQVGSSYTSGVHTTVSIYKSSEVNNIPLYATINMKVKSIGDNLSSEALKWTVTKGNATSNGEVLASGNFSSLTTDSELSLLTNFEVTTTMSEYTIWIWLDETLASPSMSDETLDVSVWTQVDQIKANTFEVTTLTNSYQTIKATIVNSNKKIVSYQISDSNTIPTVWIDIPTSEQNNIYNVEYTVNNTGVYYLWIKDENGKTISKRVEIGNIDNTPPVCTWSGNESNINTNSTGTIILTCADNEIGVDKSTGTINISNITLSNSNITISNINREEINNGYKYTLTIKTGSTLGSTTMTVPSNIIKNTMNLGNEESSTIVTIADYYTISYKDVGNTDFSGTHEDEYATNYLNGDIVTLDIPTRKGYTFMGYYLSSVGSGDVITKLENQTGNLTLYADWKDNPPYGVASLSLTNGKFTLTLSNYGDDGSGLTGTYGFALTTNSNCSAVTYTDQTGILKEYSESYTYDTTYYGCIKLTDKSGSVSYLSTAGVKYSYTNINQLYTTSGKQTYTIPATGTYKLEVWGAQGGTHSTSVGGYGGYSVGSVSLTKGTILYLYIGGTTTSTDGGYNGGGTGVSNVYGVGQGGGGATHIATVDGLLSTLSSKTSNILIVAGGGGGGASWTDGNKYYSGGGGGGIQGVVGSKYSDGSSGTAGNQTSGNAFGVGQNGISDWSAGSGGGYYGGKGGKWSAGAGGSGYIGNSSLTSKVMYCYNCTTSTDTATKTNTTTNVSSTPTANYAKSGDGAARIIALISTDVSSLVLTYNNNEGSGCYSKTIVNGSTYGDLCTPYREGYTFLGWYTETSGGTKVTSSTKVEVTSNQTIYAKWETSTKPVISFSLDGNSSYVRGNITSTINVSKGSNSLDASTFKYTWSADKSTTPDKIFMTGNSYTLEKATGKYYLIAEACDKNNNCTKGVSNIFYVDNEAPTGTLSLTSNSDGGLNVTITANDNGSGIKEYGYLMQTTSTCPTTGYTISKNKSYTFNEETPGTYYICTKIIDNAGNESIISNSIVHKGKTVEYSQSGKEYTYTVPVSGYYKLETWGAQGGGKDDYPGGYGGYSEGVVKLNKGDVLYINIGGSGLYGTGDASVAGGYNGGGAGGCDNDSSNGYCGSGGGATHIATVSGLLSTLSSKTSNILIVAGGGGGKGGNNGKSSAGGSAGGIIGSVGIPSLSSSSGTGGSQVIGGKGSSNGSFGAGGSDTSVNSWGRGGGGGGFYGGGSGTQNSGGGGSGYIGNALLANKTMYCYNCTESGSYSAKTVSTTCTNATATEKCSKQGNGYAKISFVSTNYDSTQFSDGDYEEMIYSGTEQKYTIPISGYYKLETWGAQGGGQGDYLGGYGGYSEGVVKLNKGDVLYINIGGAGLYGTGDASVAGGYNGGGSGGCDNDNSNGYCGSGGGATHIATVSGLLSTLSSKTSNILIVSGGGGGKGGNSGKSSAGGSAGGMIGSMGIPSLSSSSGTGGSQVIGGKGSSNGSFGAGGSDTSVNSWGRGGGGGGYYGGGSGTQNSGGGGSGYIGNTLLTNKTMYCYNCTESGSYSAKTVSTTCTSETATENCSKQGNGHVKITYISTNYDTTQFSAGDYEEMIYSGTEQKYTITISGTYKLETWGAQGGGQGDYLGGYGGYSAGTVKLNKGDILYINIGGAGSYGTGDASVAGGYNGGGAGGCDNDNSNGYCGSGGGATHIATVSGLLSTLSSKTSNILIVAGGGGGRGGNGNGGYGTTGSSSGGSAGGMTGSAGTPPVGSKDGTGGTQTSGGTGSSSGTFGLGGSDKATDSWGRGGGGGGFYGGGSGTRNSGGGGSGYIGNSLLTNKYMYCYNCTASSDTNTKTVSTTCTNEVATEKCSKQGNGYVKITYIG